MWCIVGLGNPGRKYDRTRHNAGFMVADELARRWGIDLREDGDCIIAEGSAGTRNVILVEPLTFMNLSGRAVRRVTRYRNITRTALIVVHDDLDIEVGRVKLRIGGSSGGHKGVASIIAETGGEDFIRVKVGVGRDPLIPAERYVLTKFPPAEAAAVAEAIQTAADAVEMIIAEGATQAMNHFNRRSE